jgi:multidrug efflux pump subunit AcrA (membrane-fusion protein)
MPDDPNSNDERKLPWPNETDPRELAHEFSDPSFADRQRVANSFADPNSLDDARLGKAFIETNSSKKKKKPVVAERVHKPASRRPLYLFLLAFFALFAIVVLIGWLSRHGDRKAIDERAERQRNEKPVVEVVRVERSKTEAGLVVPGTTLPVTEAYVYARANGYLKTRLVDIGDHVRKGQLLAVVDAPDLDAQVAQARQQLLQAQQQVENQKSNLALQLVTVQRYRVLVAKGVLSRQQGDQQETNYQQQVANVDAAQRNVDAFRENLNRVLALQSYEQVCAPFSGVITQRNVDVGALISAAGATTGGEAGPAPQGQSSSSGGSSQAGQSNNSGSSGSTSTAATPAQSPGQGGPLFGIADVTRLRILVSVPESFATAIHPGEHAQLSVQEYAGTPFTGEITRTSDTIDPNTRTLLTEVQIDNHAGKLIPGMFTLVTFPPSPRTQAPVMVSGDAIATRHDHPELATVVNGRIHYVPITIGRDFGDSAEILTGVQPGDIVVTDVTDEVVEGAAVQVHYSKTAAEPHQPSESHP